MAANEAPVVVVIGIRIIRSLRVAPWWPTFRAMLTRLRELRRDPEAVEHRSAPCTERLDLSATASPQTIVFDPASERLGRLRLP